MGLSFGQQEQQSQQTSASKSQASSTPTDLTPDAFKNMQPGLASTIMKWLGGGTTPTGGGFGGAGASGDWAEYGQNVLTVPETDNEKAIRSMLMDDLSGTRQQLIEDTQKGNFVDPTKNPFLNDYIKAAQRTTLEGLTETLDRALPSRFTMAGQFVEPQGSSAFDRAAAIATRGVANAVGDIATNIGFNAYNSERQIQNQSIAAGQQETQTTIANLTAQGLPRIIQQYGVDKGLELFKTQLAGILDALKTAAGLASPTIAQSSQSSSSSKSQGTSHGEGWNAGVNLNPTAPGVG